MHVGRQPIAAWPETFSLRMGAGSGTGAQRSRLRICARISCGARAPGQRFGRGARGSPARLSLGQPTCALRKHVALYAMKSTQSAQLEAQIRGADADANEPYADPLSAAFSDSAACA